MHAKLSKIIGDMFWERLLKPTQIFFLYDNVTIEDGFWHCIIVHDGSGVAR